MKIGDIVKEYFPNATEEEIEHIIWGRTGFPGALSKGEITFRKQLQECKEAREQGKDTCFGCGKINNLVLNPVSPKDYDFCANCQLNLFE